MNTLRFRNSRLHPAAPALPALLALLAIQTAAPAQEGAATRSAQDRPAPTTREQMWFAPTAEDWQKPVRITFQRTWEDALAVAKETGRPILVCVNMDGEIASEHYAGIRYRQPEIAALYEPYVCVIASVYRHNARDFDEQGRRILCPRFGSVTCGEHIAIEPVLYEQFMDGRRIAPRHIMVELDGKETYDVFYAWDTDSVFQAIRKGIAERPGGVPPPVIRGDRPVLERVASRDIRDRDVVEKAYLDGDAALRRTLLEAAHTHADAAPVDLLRLGVFGLDTELNQMARRALAQTRSENATDLLAEALRVPMDAGERKALVAALGRLGESSPRARTLATVHQGLDNRASSVDVASWSKALEGGASYAPAADRQELIARIDRTAKAAVARPEDANAQIELAEANLAQAIDPTTRQALSSDPRTARKYARLMLEDAARAAREAERLGAPAWRVNSVLAVAAHHLGNQEEAYARAEAAMGGMPPDPQGWSGVTALALFAEARQLAIVKAVREKKEWPAQWLTDLNAAYSLLARHPLGTDTHVVSHYDFLHFFKAEQAGRVLEQGLARFPESWELHDRLRGRILDEKGADGLEPAYAALLARPDAARNLPWFAGYAAIVAAEFHRRAGNADKALAAYDRAIACYGRAVQANPESRATSDHYVAMALGGRARIALERKEYEKALAEVQASFTTRPDAAASLDGLNISTVDTAKMLRVRLVEAKRDDLVATLDAALGKLDPEMLRLPAYEREGPPGPGAPARPGRPRRR
ncbi:MAG: hypothetical protein IT458_12320 [Planctomycetes bacterium]|nr:hypothetical protein [Planctomycetota bacterium]